MIYSPSVRAISEVETVNTLTYSHSLAGLNDGSFVIVWEGRDDDGQGIFGQRFDASGNRLGAEFQINTFTASGQFDPSITATADGGFYVVWTSNLQDGFWGGIYGQKFNANGEKVGVEQQISSNGNTNQYGADITSFDDGSIFVAWSAIDAGEWPLSNIHGRGFSATGEALSTEFQLNEDAKVNHGRVSLSALEVSAFAASWIAVDAPSEGYSQLQARSFESLTGDANQQVTVEERGTLVRAFSTETVAIDTERYYSIWSSTVSPNHSYITSGHTKLREISREGDFLSEMQGTWNGRGVSAQLNPNGGVQLFLDGYESGLGPYWQYDLGTVYVSGYIGENIAQPVYRNGKNSTSTRLQDGTIVVAWVSFVEYPDPADFPPPEPANYQLHFQRFALNHFPEGEVVISGATIVGETLRANVDDLTDGDGIGELRFQWLRGGTEISDATSPEYVLTEADIGRSLFIRVSYTDGEGTEERLESDPTTLVGIFLEGTEDNDSLTGGHGNDRLLGLGGKDTLWGGGFGEDTLDGGTGDDFVEGGGHLLGGDGNDSIWGGAGNDFVNGGEGTDQISGGDGDDTIFGGESDTDLRDIIFAGAGNDSIDGGYGNDLIYGMGGDDTIAGGAGADDLRGQDGSDVITGSAYSDIIFGNAGDDFVNGGFGSDRINGGSGADKFFHVGVEGHGSDWVQDYNAAEGDVLLFGNALATRDQFQVNFAHTENAEGERSGDDAIQEAFVIYRPTGQILWALVDGEGQASINLKIGDDVFDLLA